MSIVRDLTPEQKYSKDGPFNDPVVRCDSCQTLLLRADIQTHGMCKHCGHTRVRNLRSMSEGDWARLQAWVEAGKIDADFLKVFEGVEP